MIFLGWVGLGFWYRPHPHCRFVYPERGGQGLLGLRDREGYTVKSVVIPEGCYMEAGKGPLLVVYVLRGPYIAMGE